QNMRIANPIYDTFFKYMIANVEVAKYIIENLLDKKVVKLQPIQQEKVIHGIKELRIIRYDYSCTIQLDDKTERSIIVELQKSENQLDVGRFRNYLAKHYKEESVLANGNTDYLPIIAIYFLGFNLEHTNPFIKAECNLIDLNNHELITQDKDEFIEKLSHDIYLVQINRIKKEATDKLSQIFSMFNQNYKVEHDYKYKDAVLDIPDDKILAENKNIFLHLHHMLDSSDVMDDFEEAVRVNKIINNELLEGEKKGKAEGIAEGALKTKLEIAKKMLSRNILIEYIVEDTGLTKEQIQSLI
ncbi:MAG: hypothetical protein RLZZ210_1185, partial [Pseudomonadota bacterium]